MLRNTTITSVRALACLAVTACVTGGISEVARADTAVTGPGTVTVLSVPSADSDLAVRSVYVYRPSVPKGTTLPVLYMLHGYPGHPPALARWMASSLDKAFEHGAAPFVVAIPDGNGRRHPDTEWADSVDGRTLVETSLVKRVLPAVEGARPLPAGMRAIGGFSMGGYGAANIGLRHPDLFGQIVGISGYYHTDDRSGMFGGRRSALTANTPDDLVSAASGRRIQLFESASESDRLIKHQAADFGGRLQACHCVADLEVKVVPGDHDVDFVGAVTPSVVAFLDHGWTAGPLPHREKEPAPTKSRRGWRGRHAKPSHRTTGSAGHVTPRKWRHR